MNTTKIFSAIAICSILMSSCHKTVTPRKLDGEWTLSNSSKTETISDVETGETSKWTKVCDGTTTTETDFDGTVTSYAANLSFSFDKEKGSFTEVEKSYYSVSGDIYYFSYSNGFYVPEGYYTQNVSAESTMTSTGTFTITGGTGEIEKNTQIVLNTNNTDNLLNKTYTYKDGSASVTDLSGKYMNINNTYVLLPTTKEETINHTGVNIETQLLTVTSLKKGVLEIDVKEEEAFENTIITSEYKMTLKQK